MVSFELGGQTFKMEHVPKAKAKDDGPGVAGELGSRGKGQPIKTLCCHFQYLDLIDRQPSS